MFIVIMARDSTSEPNHRTAKSFKKAVEIAHKFFLHYDFIVHNGKPWDGGNSESKTGYTNPEDEGYKCFSSVVMNDGMVAEFVHCNGDGPVCKIQEEKYRQESGVRFRG